MEKIFRLCLPCLVCVVALLVLGGVITWQNREPSHPDERQRRSGDVQTFLGGGAIYVRWGRLSCPKPDTELVYQGAAAGGYFAHAGSPANLLCLPRVPTWGRYNDAWEATKVRSRLYGVEYRPQASDFPFSHENAETLVNHNVPCAVCRSKLRITQLMVPGRKNCIEDWHLEYSGYLMSGCLDLAGSSEFVCVDKDPEADPAGYRPETSHLLFTVESKCGSIPCPNYVDGREVTCSVCTK